MTNAILTIVGLVVVGLSAVFLLKYDGSEDDDDYWW